MVAPSTGPYPSLHRPELFHRGMNAPVFRKTPLLGGSITEKIDIGNSVGITKKTLPDGTQTFESRGGYVANPTLLQNGPAVWEESFLTKMDGDLSSQDAELLEKFPEGHKLHAITRNLFKGSDHVAGGAKNPFPQTLPQDTLRGRIVALNPSDGGYTSEQRRAQALGYGITCLTTGNNCGENVVFEATGKGTVLAWGKLVNGLLETEAKATRREQGYDSDSGAEADGEPNGSVRSPLSVSTVDSDSMAMGKNPAGKAFLGGWGSGGSLHGESTRSGSLDSTTSSLSDGSPSQE